MKETNKKQRREDERRAEYCAPEVISTAPDIGRQTH